MENRIVLFVTHTPRQCGVYEFGKNVFNGISTSQKYNFIKAECDSLDELNVAIKKHNPAAIIYNYHPSVLPWLCAKISKGIYRNNLVDIKAVQIGIIHEITQQVADTATSYGNKFILGPSPKKLNSLLDFYIAADPTYVVKDFPLVLKTGRLIPSYNKDKTEPPITTIGSFGFATPKKGFERLVQKVQEEFDEAVIRLNMPSADFGDANGENAKFIAANCKSLITKPGIKLEISHHFMHEDEVLDFLAGNSMNIFMYEDTVGRGISSAVDNAMAVKKPNNGVSDTFLQMCSHILQAMPSICDSRIIPFVKNILNEWIFDRLRKYQKTTGC